MTTPQARRKDDKAPEETPTEAPTELTISSPPPKTATTQPRTEGSQVNKKPPLSFVTPREEIVPIGNPTFERMLQHAGHLGLFLSRQQIEPTYELVPIAIAPFREGIRLTLEAALLRLIRLKGFIDQDHIEARAADIAETLTDGCMVFLYMRLRSISLHVQVVGNRFMKRPKVPEKFELPAPFSLAIQLIGAFRVCNLSEERNLLPTVIATSAANYCLSDRTWSVTGYTQAVEYAKSLGMVFSIPDQSSKLGSCWWTLIAATEEDFFELRCALPESNYLDGDVAIRCLWCINQAGGFHSVLTNLNVGQNYYGSMLRNPHEGINLTCYFGISEDSEQIWNVM